MRKNGWIIFQFYFKFLRNLNTISCSSSTNLHFHHNCTGFPFQNYVEINIKMRGCFQKYFRNVFLEIKCFKASSFTDIYFPFSLKYEYPFPLESPVPRSSSPFILMQSLLNYNLHIVTFRQVLVPCGMHAGVEPLPQSRYRNFHLSRKFSSASLQWVSLCRSHIPLDH